MLRQVTWESRISSVRSTRQLRTRYCERNRFCSSPLSKRSVSSCIMWSMNGKYRTRFQYSFGLLAGIFALLLQSHYPNRRSASKILENRATSADCRPTSAPILAEFFVGRRLFCRSTQVKSFVDRSANFHGFCHRWSVGRWSPDDRSTVGRRFEGIYIMISAEGRPIIGRQSADNRQTVGRLSFTKESSADIRRYRPSFGRWSPDCRPIIKCGLRYIFFL